MAEHKQPHRGSRRYPAPTAQGAYCPVAWLGMPCYKDVSRARSLYQVCADLSRLNSGNTFGSRIWQQLERKLDFRFLGRVELDRVDAGLKG